MRDYTPEGVDEYLRINYYFEYVRDVHKANFCIMYFLNGTVAGYVGYDLYTGEELPLLDDFTTLSLDHPLMKQVTTDVNAKQGGFYLSNNKQLMIATSFPIQSIFYSDMPIGVMVYARYPLREYAQDLAVRSQMCVTIYTIEELGNAALKSRATSIERNEATVVDGIDPDWKNNDPLEVFPFIPSHQNAIAGRECWREDFGNVTSNAQRMATLQVYTDIYGKNGVIVRSDIPRYINNLGNTSFGWAYGMVGLVAIVMSLSIVTLIEVCVLSPILGLGKEVREITHNDDFSKRVTVRSRSEVGILTSRINHMLTALESSKNRLADDHKKLQQLLEKLAIEEHKARTIMNSIPDFILSVNCVTGIVLNANAAFYSKFRSAAVEVENVIHISQLFKSYTDDELLTLFEQMSTQGTTVETTIYNKFDRQLPVQLSAHRVRLYIKDQLIEAYVVLARNLTEQKEMQESLEAHNDQIKNMAAQIEFDYMLRSPEMRDKFKEWCLMEQSEENILFIESVEEYRMIRQAHERAMFQQEIVDTYLKDTGTRPLNLGAKIKESEIFQLEKAVGQIDAFDNIESAIRLLMITDTFCRFQNAFISEKKHNHRKKQSTDAGAVLLTRQSSSSQYEQFEKIDDIVNKK
jgi:methyl-accepting chemotaxis protein